MAQPLKKRTLEELKGAELASVLAGLRMLQANVQKYGAAPAGIHEIYTDTGRFKGLTPEEIGQLCRRLNTE